MEKERDQIIDHLTHCFTRDLLTAEDFEYRVERVHEATTLEQLRGLIEDLPALPGGQTIGRPREGEAPFPRNTASNSSGFPTAIEPQSTYAIFSEQHLAGNWLTRGSTAATVALGSLVMDLRDLNLGPYTEISLHAVMGEITIILPDYPVLVDSNVTTVLAEFKRKDKGRAPENAPQIRLKGFALLSQITVRHSKRRDP